MKNYLIFILTFIIIGFGCKEDEKPDDEISLSSFPTLKIFTTVNSADPLMESSIQIDSVRIGEKIHFQVIARSNMQSNIPLHNFRIGRTIDGQEELLHYSMLDDKSFELIKSYYVSGEEVKEEWKFSVQDSLGLKFDTIIDINVVDTGIFGRWNFNANSIDASFIEQDIEVVQAYFNKDNTYAMEFSNSSGEIETTNGSYTQNKNQYNNTWNVVLNQETPVELTYKGIFQIFTPSPDSIYLYYVQTEPDIGLSIPNDFKNMNDLINGEHILAGTQFYLGID